MKFIKQFSTIDELENTKSSLKHGDGVYIFGVSTVHGIENVTMYDQRHPGANCLKLNPVNMSPVKLDSSSTKKIPAVGDVLYSTADGKLTLDAQANSVNNTAIAICVIPEVLENFTEGDDSTGAVKTARFVSINYMNYTTPATGSKDPQYMTFGNYYNTIGNVKGGTDETSYVGGKWNTQQCLSKATNQDQNICDGVTNDPGEGYCAPACCCVGYSTLGTKSGDWYLPSVGELYQLSENLTVINEKRTALVGSGFHDHGYWSSREYSSNSSGEYYVFLENGYNYYTSKTDGGTSVLAFLALEVDPPAEK